MPVQFSQNDLKTIEGLERVLRQFQNVLHGQEEAYSTAKTPDVHQLAAEISPIVRDQLQAPGGSPLNLQSLLPFNTSAVVTGPSSSVNNDVAAFDGTGGNLLKDSGILYTDITKGPASATNNDVAVFDGATGKLIKDSSLLYTDIVKGPGSATSGNLAVFDGTTGKLIKDGGAVPTSGGGGLSPYTAPVSASFAWINQGTATINTTLGVNLYDVSAGLNNQIRIRKKAAVAAPYTITLGCIMSKYETNFGAGGIILRESGSGKLVTLAWGYAGGNLFRSDKYDDPNTFNANYGIAGNITPIGPNLWLRIVDDGVNRGLQMSVDGINFIQMASVGNTDFITPDEYGFFINPYATEVSMTVLSWNVT